MKLPFTCPQCDQENRENGNFIPSIEQRDVIITNQITYEYTCVNVNIRMYNFDDVQCTVIPSVAYGFVTGMNLQLC